MIAEGQPGLDQGDTRTGLAEEPVPGGVKGVIEARFRRFDAGEQRAERVGCAQGSFASSASSSLFSRLWLVFDSA